MAERRMFAKSIVLSGPFIRLPAKAQLLYFHLGMQADDDGFISAPELAMRAAGAAKRDLNQLVTAGYLLRFDSGLLVVKHWFTHNNIKKDRFRPTVYQQELAYLYLQDKVYEMVPAWNQNGATAEPQIKQNKNKENETKENQRNTVPGSGAEPGEREQWPKLSEIMCYALENQIQTDVLKFYGYYQDLCWPGHSRHTWRALLKRWEEEHAGTPGNPMD